MNINTFCKKTKVCTKCNIEKPKNEDNFYRRSGSDGYRSICKSCLRRKGRERYEKNKDKYLEYKRERRINDRDHVLRREQQYRDRNRTRINNHLQNWRERNREKERIRGREYYKNNAEKVNSRHRKHYEENKELYYNKMMKRVHTQRNLPYNFSESDWNNCKEYFNNKCAHCESDEFLERDHFIPLSKGGGYAVENIVPSCRSCNRSKWDYKFEEWYVNSGHYDEKRMLKIYDYLKIHP